MDASGRCLYANDRLARMLGYRHEELLGQSVAQWLGGEGRDAAVAALTGARTDAGTLEVQLEPRDGRARWVLLDASPVFEAAGRRVGTLALAHDITERRRAEAGLRAIADVSRALANQRDGEGVAAVIAQALGGGVLVGVTAAVVGIGTAQERTVTFCACSCVDERIEGLLRRLLGHPVPLAPGSVAEEVLRGARALLLGPEGVEHLLPPVADVARQIGVSSMAGVPLAIYGRAIGLMNVFRWGGGPPLDGEDLALLTEVGERAAMALEHACLFEAQKRTNERSRLLADTGALLAATPEIDAAVEKLARLIAQSFADACWVQVFDDSAVGAFAAAASDPALEQAVRQVMGPAVGPLARLPESLRRVLETGRAELVRNVDDPLVQAPAASDARWQDIRALKVRSLIRVPLVARDRALGVVTLGRTRGRSYDEEDLAFADELGRRAALAIDNARLYKDATHAIAVRDEFLSMASHELNTPLTSLKLQIDALRRGTTSSERVPEKLDSANHQVARLEGLVASLLDISRFDEKEPLPLHKREVDLAAIVQDVVRRIDCEAKHAGSPVQVTAKQSCRGLWDDVRIAQVIGSLLSNALKFGAGRPVEVEVFCTDESARVLVRDHGVGISRESQSRIFDRFARASSARHYGGFGLGLWIAKRIVDASGGAISVESEPERGSAFVVELPRRGVPGR